MKTNDYIIIDLEENEVVEFLAIEQECSRTGDPDDDEILLYYFKNDLPENESRYKATSLGENFCEESYIEHTALEEDYVVEN